MTIGQLLSKIKEGKAKKIFTDQTEVVIELPSEIYRSTNGSDKGKLVPGTATSLPIETAFVSDTANFPEEDEIPSTLNIILATDVACEFYLENCLVYEKEI